MQIVWKRKHFAIVACMALSMAATAAQASVTFSTFVTGTNISNAIGQNNVIGFAYAGNKFVGTVYVGSNNNQLYQTSLDGTVVTPFGALPSANGEAVVSASLGQGGFAAGNVFASGANTQIYQFGNGGGTPTLFASVPNNGQYIRQIFFDPGSSFGGNMLVTTSFGNIYSISSAGAVNFIASTGEDTEGMDIASSKYGSFAGDLLTTSEDSGHIRAITPGGAVTILDDASGNPIHVNEAETLSVVPLNFGVSGNPLEGFYVANYPENIQVANVTSQFSSYLGDAIVTEEDSANSPLWDLNYSGSGNSFALTEIGILPNQSEDGEFVTAQRIQDVNPPVGVPEPVTLSMFGAGLAGAVAMRRHKKKAN